jgi:hypothetical protein
MSRPQRMWGDADASGASHSVFARILDKDQYVDQITMYRSTLTTPAHSGGHFSIRSTSETSTKQQYLPSTNVLCTKFLSDVGVGQILGN